MPVALAPAGTLLEKCFHALCTGMMSECGLKAVRRFSTVSLNDFINCKPFAEDVVHHGGHLYPYCHALPGQLGVTSFFRMEAI